MPLWLVQEVHLQDNEEYEAMGEIAHFSERPCLVVEEEEVILVYHDKREVLEVDEVRLIQLQVPVRVVSDITDEVVQVILTVVRVEVVVDVVVLVEAYLIVPSEVQVASDSNLL